jgi:formylglycine-generating enzyme required for sulfatase activity
MTSTGAAESGRLKVFISYSRKDEDFAQELLAGLELVGFEPYLNKHDIAAGEDWAARLGPLIEAADTVVFVISPDAVASERCVWEVDHSVSLKKRLLPIVWRRVEEAQVPQSLKHLNYIFFDRPLTFVPSLKALTTALRTHLEWVREHTRIGEAALRWHTRGRAEVLLLRGEELTAAKAWLAAQPQYAPEPTLLHHEFIKAAEDAEAARTSAERQRLDQMAAAQDERDKALAREKAALRRGQRALAVASGLLACIIFGGVGWYNQKFLKEQYQWRVVMGPSVLTAEQEREKAAQPGSDFTECAIGCPTMVVVPAGKFTMGSPSNEPERSDGEDQVQVAIARPFAVGRFAITRGEFAAFVAATGHTADRGCLVYTGSEWEQQAERNWHSPGFPQTDRHPVVCISWNDAKAYVAWLASATGKRYRLLSEAEREYAARAGTTTPFWWGSTINPTQANYNGTAEPYKGGGSKGEWRKATVPVDTFEANPWGLYNVHGDVLEWSEDCWNDKNAGNPGDGTARTSGDCTLRVLRGASWRSDPGFHRSALRFPSKPAIRNYSSGFRVARTLSP